MPIKPIPPSAFRTKPPIIQREFKGGNRLDPFSILPEFASSTRNLTSRNYPALSVRPGYSVLGTFGTKVLGMGVWKETELHVIFDDGTWRRLNSDGTWTQLVSGLSTTAEWTFTNFKGNLSDVSLVGTNGVDSARYYNGSAVSVLSGVPSGGKYITQYADRLWCAVGNELKASAWRMATDWSTVDEDEGDSWYTVIESPDGEEICGLSAGFTKLAVIKPSAMFELYGYSPLDYEVRPVSFDVGQFNNRSSLTMDGWLYQLYDTGLYRYAGGTAPNSDFAERVKGYFGSINPSLKTQSSMGTDGSVIYASVPGRIIEHDPKKDTFYSWEDIHPLHFASIGTTLYIGDSSGRVLKLGGTTDNGTPIQSEWVSKWFTAPSMAQTMRWLRMWITIDLPVGSSINVYLNKSDNDPWEPVGSIAASVNIQRRPIYVQSMKVTNAQQIRFKITGSGPFTLHEVAWESDYLPLR